MSMHHKNPTPIQLGAEAELGGRRYRVAGRMVLAMEEGGETYTWNEFYLIEADGRSATLVYEMGENGPEWRLFRLLEPAPTITAAEAAQHRVGQWINLTGNRLRVTCVDESRVIFLEGQAPEGVELGDVAHYFNAEGGNQMIVVSWTGDEVEVFQGVQLPGYAVYRAFGLNPPPPQARPPGGSGSSWSGGDDDAGGGLKSGAIGSILRTLVVGGGVILFGLPMLRGLWSTARQSFPNSGIVTPSSRPPNVVVGPPTVKLALGAGGELDGSPTGIAGRDEVEIARVGFRQGRREYLVTNAAGGSMVLVQTRDSRGDRWTWWHPIEPTEPLTPNQAGARRLGDRLTVATASGPLAEAPPAQVREIFLTRHRAGEGQSGLAPRSRPGTEHYGVEAQVGTNRYAVRWTTSAITYYRVTPATGPEVDVFKGTNSVTLQ